ncbi:MAG: MBL fold metallo-hydrolase [bacterium]|nr:MBL fold metallo-hydrolase [bacterium]
MQPAVEAFFDGATNTITYVVSDPASKRAAIVDPVLDFDLASGRTSTKSADTVIAFVRERGLSIDWLLESHVHADHLSSAPYLEATLGGRTAIGEHVTTVQQTFGKLFHAEAEFRTDGSQFDHLFRDEEVFAIGDLEAKVLHTPGHTPACAAYVVGDCAFVGDTLFMPDFGSARCDFPGGDARQLYRSIRRLLALPASTRLFVGHDYKAPGRNDYAWETTVADQRAQNVHVKDGIDEEAFVKMRTERDATLGMPRLLLPAVQVNMRAGQLPPPEANGVRYLKLPIDAV